MGDIAYSRLYAIRRDLTCAGTTVRVIENPKYKRTTAPPARAPRWLRSIGAAALRAFIKAWNIAFPLPPFPGPTPPLPSGPDDPSPIAKAAALREPALLYEHIEEPEKKVG